MDLLDIDDYNAKMQEKTEDFLDRCDKAWADFKNKVKQKIKDIFDYLANLSGRKLDWFGIKKNMNQVLQNLKQTLKNIKDIIVNLNKALSKVGDITISEAIDKLKKQTRFYP